MTNESMDYKVARLQGALKHRTIGAVATPMDQNGQISPEVVASYAASLATSVDSVCVWAHTGRGLHLTQGDRCEILGAFRSAFDGPVLAAVGPDASVSDSDFDGQLASTIAMARDAAQGGADGLMVYPAPALRPEATRRARTLRLHEETAMESGIPVIGFYLYDGAGGVAYDDSLLEELCRRPGIAGVKLALLDDAIRCQDAIGAIQKGGGQAITGEDRMFGPSLMWGADAALVGLGAAAAELTTSVVDRWFEGDTDGFVSASVRLDSFASVIFRHPMDGYVQRMLWVAEAEGIIPADMAYDPHGVSIMATEKQDVLASFEAAVSSTGLG